MPKNKLLSTLSLMTLAIGAATYAAPASAQIVGGDAFLQGDFAETGLGPSAYFGSLTDSPGGFHARPGAGKGTRLGFVVDRNKDGWADYDGDFFLPGTAYEGWGITINGTDYQNKGNGPVEQVPGTLSNFVADADKQSVEWNGIIDGVEIKKVVSLRKIGQEISITVTLKNTNPTALTDVYYARGFDPDNNQPINATFATTNTVVSNPPTDNLALVTSTQVDDSFIALVAKDPRARAGHVCTFGTVDPDGFWNEATATHSGTATADQSTCLAFKFDSIAAGESITFRYFYALSLDSLSDIEEQIEQGDTQDLVAPWNGFLEQINILSLQNVTDAEKTVTITLANNDGTAATPFDLTLAAKEQRDLIVNDFDGYSADSYGTVTVEPSANDEIVARMVFYRNRTNPIREAASQDPFEFSFSIPLANPTVGDSFGVINTYQPSLDSASAQDLVPNWVQVQNLDTVDRAFTVVLYSQAGEELSSTSVTVIAGGRYDLSPVVSGRVAGLVKIDPQVDTAPYLAQVFRYGVDSASTASANDSWSFAQGAVTKSGSTDQQLLVATTGSGARSWVVIANTDTETRQARVVITAADGTELSNEIYTLAALNQLHIGTAGVVPEGESALVKVVPLGSATIYSEVNSYYYDESDHTLAAKTESSSVLSTGVKRSDFNTFFSHQHWAKLFNTANAERAVAIKLINRDGATVGERVAILEPLKTFEFDLFGFVGSTPEESSYGIVELSGPGVDDVFGEILRIRSDGGVHGANSHTFE